MLYQMWIERTVAASERDALEDVTPVLIQRSLLPEHFELDSSMRPADVLQQIEKNLQDKTVEVNLEALRTNHDFMRAFGRLGRAMGLDIKLQKFRSTFDLQTRQASIAFELKGKSYERAWRLDESWIDDTLIPFMNNTFVRYASKELLADDSHGRSGTVYALERGSAKLIDEVKDYARLDQDPDVLKSGKVKASGTISVLGLVATFLGIWAFMGLSQAIMISVAVWLVFFGVMFSVHSLSARSDRAFMQADDDSAEVMG